MGIGHSRRSNDRSRVSMSYLSWRCGVYVGGLVVLVKSLFIVYMRMDRTPRRKERNILVF